MASSVSLLLSNVVTPSPLPSLRSHGRRLLHAREGFLTGYCNGRLAFMNGKKDGDEKGGTMMQKKRRGAQIRGGLPLVSSVPVLGPILNTVFSPLVLLAVYAIGATKFFSGFSSTTYSDSLPTKLGLTLAWPVLFIASQKYRSNFKRAVR